MRQVPARQLFLLTPTLFYRMSSSKVVYYAVDLELSGPSKDTNFILQIGAAAFADGKVIDTFSVSMDAPTQLHGFDSKTMRDFWSSNMDLLARLQATAVSPREGMRQFTTWLDVMASLGRLRHLTDFSQFDSAWLDLYHERYTDMKCPLYLRYPSIHVALNVDDMYRVVLKDATTPWVDTQAVCLAAGVPMFKGPQKHDAASDALEIGTNFFNIATALSWKV